MIDDTTLLELIPEYALGALDAEETRLIDDLLTRSEPARLALADYEAMLAGLVLLTVPQHVAPASLTEQFAQRIKSESIRQTVQTPIVPVPKRRIPRALLIAAAILMIATGLAALFNRISPLDPIARQIAEVLNDPAAVGSPLAFTLPNGTPSGRFIYNKATKRAVLQMAQLPALPPGQQYQLWLIDGNGAQSVGLADGKQTQEILVNSGSDLNAYRVFAITIELTGGAPKPSGDPIAVATL